MRIATFILFLLLAATSYAQQEGSEENPTEITFTPVYVIQGYNGAYGCSWPVNTVVFEAAKEKLMGAGSAEERLSEAQLFVMNNCLLTDQVHELLMLFSNDDHKLALGKDCYKQTYDIDDYSKVYKSFSDEAKLTELKDYVRSKKM